MTHASPDPRRITARRALARIAGAVVVVGVLLVPRPGAAQTGVRVDSDIHYATHGGIPLLLDAYLPPGAGPFPAVVVIPGGRWVDIDKTKHSDVPTYFAEHGIAAFSITYRSALEFPYPAAIDDVSSAVRWVRSHAADYQVDPTEIGAVGVSAGGHLAALVATMGSGPLDVGSRVDMVASWSGPMDLRPMVDSSNEDLRIPAREFLGCSATGPCDDVAREASPITYVDPSDPPMYLVNGSDDLIPADQVESMSGALDAAGVDNRVLIAQGGHGAGYGGGDKVLDLVIPFVQAWIAGRDAPVTETGGEPGQSASGDEGKDGQPAGATASPAADASPVKEAGSTDGRTAATVTTGGSSSDVLAVAVAMVAVVIVLVQFMVIGGLRRRIAALGSAASQSAARGAGVEGT